MAQSRVFSLIGDSNVKRHSTMTNRRACPALSASQILQCGRLQLLSSTLEQVQATSTSCIITCLTNFLASSSGASTVALRVEPVLLEVREVLGNFCNAHPDRTLLIAPPMYRTLPLWYREGLPEILKKFSEIFSSDVPSNFYLLPSFATPDFEDDGIHLTAYSGLQFLLHLFDSSETVLADINLPPEVKSSVVSESTRCLEDRMMALEQDHRRLNKNFEMKTAIDAELADFHENQSFEDCFLLIGLPRIQGNDISPKDWQVKARRACQEVLTRLMGREVPIVVVHNATGAGRDAIVKYLVRTPSANISKEVRDKFAYFFTGGTDVRPPAFKGISIRNRLTKGTHVRIAILKLFGSRYTASNPGSKFKVLGYEPRPVLKIFPASGARVQVYNFIEAVKRLPSKFSPAEVGPIIDGMDPKLRGQLRPLFVVLSDDSMKLKSKSGRNRGPKAANSDTAQAEVADAPSQDSEESDSESESDSGEAAADVPASVVLPIPPPVPPPVPVLPVVLAGQVQPQDSGSGRSGRSQKRGASSPGRAQSKKSQKK